MPNDIPQNPIEFFRLKSAETGSNKSAGNMRRAIDSLSNFAGGMELTFDSFTQAFLGEWIASQYFSGYQSATIAYNLSKISALFNKAVAEGIAPKNDAFTALLDKLRNSGPAYDSTLHSSTFQKIRTLFLADYSSDPAKSLARDIIIFGLLSGGMTLDQLSLLKKDDYKGDNPHILRIVEKYSKPKNKYLFPLNQAHLTPRQLRHTIEGMTLPLFSSIGIKRNALPDVALADIWADLAMSCGIPAAHTAACLGEAARISALTYCATPSQLTPEEKTAIRTQIAATLADNPLRWYAMHLRRHTRYEDLTARLADSEIFLQEIFYPMEEILHKAGNRKIFETRPVISWLIFFRAQASQLNRLFHEIGDLAWGYRYLRDVKSPYAVIPDSEIRSYQQAIGTLTPAVRMLSDEDVKFEQGDYLVLLGGPMNGRHGIFIAEKKVKGDASGRIVFRIRLAGGGNANWEVNWPPSLVKKITATQFLQLQAEQPS